MIMMMMITKTETKTKTNNNNGKTIKKMTDKGKKQIITMKK